MYLLTKITVNGRAVSRLFGMRELKRFSMVCRCCPVGCALQEHRM